MTFEAEAPSLDGLIQWVEKWIGNYEDRQHGRRGRPLQPYEQRELSAYRGIHAALSDLQQARSELETRPAVEHVAEPDCACRECTAAEKPACCEGPQKIGPGYHAAYCATMAGTEFAKRHAPPETKSAGKKLADAIASFVTECDHGVLLTETCEQCTTDETSNAREMLDIPQFLRQHKD